MPSTSQSSLHLTGPFRRANPCKMLFQLLQRTELFCFVLCCFLGGEGVGELFCGGRRGLVRSGGRELEEDKNEENTQRERCRITERQLVISVELRADSYLTREEC